MRQSHQNKRGRGRSRKNSNPLSRNYESNGPDVKIRGSASHIAEKYASLARDAQSSSDPVQAENYWQHAEHYYRIIQTAEAQAQAKSQNNSNQNPGQNSNGGQRRQPNEGRGNQSQNRNGNNNNANTTGNSNGNGANAAENVTENAVAPSQPDTEVINGAPARKPARRAPRAAKNREADKGETAQTPAVEAVKAEPAKKPRKSAAVKAAEKAAEKNSPPEDVSV